MTTWFIADTHFAEQPKARQRATGLSGDELDRLIEERWRALVGQDDVVWHLGDVGDWRRLSDLPGTKHLILGNCDKEQRAIAASGVFAFIATQALVDTAEDVVLLVHNPAHGQDHDGTVIHGHLHARPSPSPRFKSVSVDHHSWSPASATAITPGWPA